MSTKNVKKVIALILSIITLFVCFSVYASNNSLLSQNNFEQEALYLSEEDVFEYLGFTCKETPLQDEIAKAKSLSPNGIILSAFGTDDFSDFTNGEYGGMYLDDRGNLTICFKENSNSYAKYAAKTQKPLGKLLKQSGEVSVDSLLIKEVKYSNEELNELYDYLYDNFNTFSMIDRFCVDIVNNKVRISIFDKNDINRVEEMLPDKYKKDMLAYEFLDPNDTIQLTATINGTSKIGNGSIYSSPAGQMWSNSRGYYGIITCGHGYTVGDKVKSGIWHIGDVVARQCNGTNDSSFFKMRSFHSYKSDKVDEISSVVPVVGSNVTLRGYQTGQKTAKVLSVSAAYRTQDGMAWSNTIEVDKPIIAGDSGGGAIGGYADGNRTARIVGINQATTSTRAYLIKGGVVINAYR